MGETNTISRIALAHAGSVRLLESSGEIAMEILLAVTVLCQFCLLGPLALRLLLSSSLVALPLGHTVLQIDAIPALPSWQMDGNARELECHQSQMGLQ